MTLDDLLDGILAREGQGVPPYLDPHDAGLRTSYGISERWHPDAWRAGPPTREQARAIYTVQYVAPFDPLARAGLDERIRVALIDDAVLSGVRTATRTLQVVLGVTVDGVIGAETCAAVRLAQLHGRSDVVLVRLVQARAHRLARIVAQDHDQARFIVGWIDRCLSSLG